MAESGVLVPLLCGVGSLVVAVAVVPAIAVISAIAAFGASCPLDLLERVALRCRVPAWGTFLAMVDARLVE